ncbi:nucleoside deaminase [Lactococcus formosensis]|uniref:nucleoside deaminase n=1 Tax=Lactococcus formosensis TaxID=1281486 RepID=UPI0022E113F1|nr:nucleoside deaminase [Lactococcus formosensis]
MNKYFELATAATIKGMRRREGGPFGATIVREGQVIAAVGNTMVRDTDPSAHAEMVAVREACQKLGTMDLSDCEIYATCEPCPMCVGVMMWANVKKVYYSSTREEAALHGFSDIHLRRYLEGTAPELFNMEYVGERTDCNQLWQIFKDIEGEANHD